MNSVDATVPRDPLRVLQARALGVGLVALIVCCVGGFFSPEQFFRSYLMAYQFVLGLGLGSLVLVMVYHLTGGVWGYVLRRILEAGMRTLPLLALLFVPLAFGLSYLYLWARPEVVANDASLQHKQIYLNVPFFLARAAFYFVVWYLLAFLLNRWSRQQDQSDSPLLTRKMGLLSGPGLVIYGVTITFACVDWVMSLQPAFRSTIFGPLVASSQILSAHAFAFLMLVWLASRSPLGRAFSKSSCNDQGNLLLTFVIIWAYLNFFQYMLVWIADERSEVIWLLPRERGGWEWVSLALVLFGLIVPFCALLIKDVKRSPRALAMVAGLLLFMQLVFACYQVLPAFPGTHISQHWMDLLMPVGLGGLWFTWYLGELQRAPLLPLHDPREVAAQELLQLDREEKEDMDEEAWEKETIHA